MSGADRREETAVQRAIQAVQDHLRRAIRSLSRISISGRDEAIHEVRKRIKKARALIRLAEGAVGHKSIRKANRRLRDAAKPLSEIRDSSVLIVALDSLTDQSAGRAPCEEFAHARAALVSSQAKMVRSVLEEGDLLARVSRDLHAIRRRVSDWDANDFGTGLSPILKQSYKACRERFSIVETNPSSEALHELRKRVKILGYQLHFCEPHPTGPAARINQLAALLADELGEIHDFDVLRAFLETLEGSGPVLISLDRRRLDLRRVALQRARVVFRDKPRLFVRSLETSIRQVESVNVEG